MINPGTDILDVTLIDGEAEISGNINELNGNIIRMLDKKFIMNEDTIFNVTVLEEDPIVEVNLSGLSIGDSISGYGYTNDVGAIISGTITKIYGS